MKRMYTCIAILVCIATLSVVSIYIMKKSNEEIFALIDNATSVYESGGNPQAEVEKIEDFWDKYYIRISYMAQSSALDDISYALAKLPHLLEKDSDEFLSELRSIRSWLDTIYNSQYPHLYSVF